MTQEGPQPSLVIPVLVASLICDAAHADSATGKKTLVGIFDKISALTFPAKQPVSVYFKLADAEGFYKVNIKFVQVNTNKVMEQAIGELKINDRRLSVDFYVNFPALPIPSEGRYEFQVWLNAIFLGGTFIDAIKLPGIERGNNG